MDAVKKQALEKQIVGGLAVVFVGVLGFNVWKNFGPAPKEAIQEAQEEVQHTLSQAALPEALRTIRERMIPNSELILQVPSPVVEEEVRLYTAHALPDPFVSPFQQPVDGQSAGGGDSQASLDSAAAAGLEPSVPDFAVQGVIWGGPKPLVIIENEVYQVGDTVRALGVTVKSIHRGGVTVELNGVEATVAVTRDAPSS